jgi:hypothetical protein
MAKKSFVLWHNKGWPDQSRGVDEVLTNQDELDRFLEEGWDIAGTYGLSGGSDAFDKALIILEK